MIRALLFDYNGVLIDDEPVHAELLCRVLAEEGLSLSEDRYWQDYVGLDDRAAFARALAEAGTKEEPSKLARLVARKAAYYEELLRAGRCPLVTGAIDLVREAAAAGMTLGVVSGALHSEVEAGLRQAGVRDRFKVVVAAESVGRSKPDPEGYRKALEALNCQPPLPERLFHPHEVLAIEDTETGLRAARSAGLATLGVAQTLPAERLESADRVVASLEQVSLPWLHEVFAEVSRA